MKWIDKFCFVAISSCISVFSGNFDPTIPVFDLGDLEDPAKCDVLIEDVRGALHGLGFFAVTNSGIDNAVIHRAFAAMDEYFALSEEEKMAHYALWTDGQRGYIPFGNEKAKGAKAFDFKEYYHIGPEYPQEVLDRLGYPPNIWPEEVDFKEAIQLYMEQLNVCKSRVQRVISLALCGDEHFLDPAANEGQHLLRVAHYPPMEENLGDQNMIWAGAHTDINLFTLLPEATAAGLEVQLADGSWLPVYARGDAIIVNAGDFTEILSNGYFKSAMHRVIAPEGERTKGRNSMVYFVHSDNFFTFKPLDHFVELVGERKYPETKRLEMFFQRMAENHQACEESLKYLGECGIMEKLLDLGTASREAMEELRAYGYASQRVLDALAELEKAES